MKLTMRAMGLACATALLLQTPFALAEEQAGEAYAVQEVSVAEEMPAEASVSGEQTGDEEMPVVVDVPLSEEELAENEARRAEEIAGVQRLLIDLGYLTGAADGVLGPRTAEALKAFQANRGLEVTGKTDEATVAALGEMAETAAAARELQQRLIDLGYLRGSADGVFGERSQAALRFFQALQGLEVTGKADDATRERLFSENVEPLPDRLTGGSKGDRVKALQQRLIQLGFMTGEADGSYGPKTARAVARFQEHLNAQGYDESLGIVANGEASAATQALLNRPGYSTYLRDLAPGDENDEVRRVESRLVTLGYMDLEADDKLDDYAVRAARAFQQAAGLEGALGKDFIDALFAEDAPVAERYVPHAIALGNRGQAVRATEQALICAGMTIKMPNGRYDDEMKEAVGRLYTYLQSLGRAEATLFSDSGYLSEEAQAALEGGLVQYREDVGRNATGGEALRVQRRLYTLYYIQRSSVDGNIGSSSVEAIQSFQKANGLAVTGIADVTTQSALFAPDAAQNPRPYRVEVDIDHQMVYVFERRENGEYEKTHSFICSTGLGNSTPRGVYLDGYPVNYWHHFEKFDCWAKYSFEVEGNIMMHSVIYSEPDTSTLRESSLYGLGQKASHGCIRLKVADAKWLFEHCSRGSLVIVIY